MKELIEMSETFFVKLERLSAQLAEAIL